MPYYYVIHGFNEESSPAGGVASKQAGMRDYCAQAQCIYMGKQVGQFCLRAGHISVFVILCFKIRICPFLLVLKVCNSSYYIFQYNRSKSDNKNFRRNFPPV